MPLCHQAVITFSCAAEDPAGWIIAEPQAAYKPRHPERTGFYQLFETHLDSYVRSYEEHFEPRSGPLLPVVVRSIEEFLSCGRLEGVFARIRCPNCRAFCHSESDFGPAIRCLPRVLPNFLSSPISNS